MPEPAPQISRRGDHWDSVYRSRSDAELSWAQPQAQTSLALISGVCPAGRVIDVGGGTSNLSAGLIDAGYEVAVLDISEIALARARERLGPRETRIRWMLGDVTRDPDLGRFDVWHDRAVFHFLTDAADRAAYVGLLARTIGTGGHAVIATFALDGPERCSGLPVKRYDAAMLAGALGPSFALLKSIREMHLTPWGAPQSFQYSVFRRVSDPVQASPSRGAPG
jgi:SAM-dependent methyltransferase